MFADLGTKLNYSTAYHPQTDGQTERVNQVLEDMLRMYVMDKPTKWEDYLHLVEFAYNNGQQASLGMSPYEALYGRRCRTPVTWDNLVNKIVLGPELLREMEQEVVKIRKNLKAAQNRQKSYVDKHRVNREFNVGDHVYLRVRPRKSSLKLGSCAKISPTYCGSFEVLERIGPIALPASTRDHNFFHVSLFKKYVHDPNHVINWDVIQVEGEFQIEPMHILARKVTMLQN